MQGVGFRPFVKRLACQTHVTGFVQNQSSAVLVEAQGSAAALDAFASSLLHDAPAISRIDRSCLTEIPVCSEDTEFCIVSSEADRARRPTITPDLALCPQCLAEMRQDGDRRFGYGLINCTECGPRYSIITDMPYDRVNTTMRRFALCEICHQQYQEPSDRRYHAQPLACPQCGPGVRLLLGDLASATVCPGQKESSGDRAICTVAELLLAGRIVAMKGIGGYHLAVRADEEGPVSELRKRKQRDAKPFALMLADLPAAEQLVALSKAGQAALQSSASPIVLARRKPGARVASSVAPGVHRLGVMLPYTPLQYLVLDAMASLAGGPIPPLVMTSANISDEPLIKDDEEAKALLPALCDAVLFHDRDIERCVDDSVLLDFGESTLQPVRRSRGYVPQPLSLHAETGAAPAAGLCLGGELKNTVAVVREGQAILSQHLADLKHPLAFAHFRKAIDDFCRLFEIAPRWIAHDLHPGYISTQYALTLARRLQVPTIAVQHHHAHAAAVLAEHGVQQDALAIVCDGVGYGSDGSVWGGELLRVSMQQGTFQRVASLPPFPLPGGDAAALETRRAAAGLLSIIGGPLADQVMARLYADPSERGQMLCLLEAKLNCPVTSAAGRWFDAVAAIVGAGDANRFEGEAPMRLEALASKADAPSRLSDESLSLQSLPPFVAQLSRRAIDGQEPALLALEFHRGFARAWANTAAQVATTTGVRTIGLSGGCFCNELLTRYLVSDLETAGLRVLRHELVPPNDGGIAFGQASVALAISRQKGWR